MGGVDLGFRHERQMTSHVLSATFLVLQVIPSQALFPPPVNTLLPAPDLQRPHPQRHWNLSSLHDPMLAGKTLSVRPLER